MSELENLTPFAHGSACGYGLDDRVYMIHCLAARFHLPPPGSIHHGPLLLGEQRAPSMADEHWGDPAVTSLKFPGQGVVARPGAEVYVVGSAYAPRGREATTLRADVRVGSCAKAVQITGARTWQRGLKGLRPSAPEPFTSMPLRYERSFGGTRTNAKGEVIAQEPRNPIGVALAVADADAVGQPLPNLEDPGDLLTSWDQRVVPAGFGPIPGSWQPRLGFAGTYDSEWIARRAPLWPKDCDPRFFGAAAPGLSAPAPFRGGEPVLLDGFAPEGPFEFSLPSFRVIAKHTYTDHQSRHALACDGVLTDTDERAITLFWRTAAPLEQGLRRLLRTTIRLLEPWEEPVE
ncbi:DUF2169 domain-containing protein [Nannocystis sp. ILAH1]|uniref:DUF2169 family type VI secretion system accessory protein n=1 Tax=Nannocystis sp. ILAH1 TaxID=2996789 RepID=UPI002271A401|nr:DUF2169 domain-containing protein [Nannocystis sp. ILAH1]MCY0989732.1 DUF2169 domain-containing protein [Nannocystis sp. ILAH1]